MLRRFICISCAAILAAIAGVFTAAPANAAGSAAPSTLTGETLTATNYFFQGGVFTCNPSGDTTFTLVVNGTAEGPYPGTFDETATVTIGPQPPGLVGPVTQFDATFTINSPVGTVSGTKHLETTTSPAAGKCVGTAPVPCTPGLTIATETFALDTTYEAAITTAGGTAADRGISHVSFEGTQTCGVEAEVHNGLFGESFTSTIAPRCDSGNRDDNHDNNGRGRGRDGHGKHGGCQSCGDEGNGDGSGADRACKPSDGDSNDQGESHGGGRR